ncbi:MAG: hypothetical protein ACD_33C00048G0002 [uncultured bacterium]|nr:MAG: hypothetical protein ACD_33C00048G0002 [uncultured bacterium]
MNFDIIRLFKTLTVMFSFVSVCVFLFWCLVNYRDMTLCILGVLFLGSFSWLTYTSLPPTKLDNQHKR